MHSNINESGTERTHSSPKSRSVISTANGCAICLLDDDEPVLKATSRLLHSAGWKSKSFTDPISFLDYARDHRPPLVVLDILMPVVNGLEVQKRLKDISPSTRVIIVTSKDDPSIRSKAMQSGASAFFRKPMDDDEFLATVESAARQN